MERVGVVSSEQREPGNSSVPEVRKIVVGFAPGAPVALGLLVASVAIGLLGIYLVTYAPKVPLVLGVALIGLLFFLFLWAGLWAIGNRVFTGRFNFWPHLAIASLTTLGGIVGSTLGSYASFAMPGWFTDRVIGLSLTAAPAFLGLLAHIDVSSGRSARVKASIAGAVAAVIAGITFLGTFAMPSSQAVTSSLGVLHPLPTGLVWKQSTDEFAEELEDLEERVRPEGLEFGPAGMPVPPRRGDGRR